MLRAAYWRFADAFREAAHRLRRGSRPERFRHPCLRGPDRLTDGGFPGGQAASSDRTWARLALSLDRGPVTGPISASAGVLRWAIHSLGRVAATGLGDEAAVSCLQSAAGWP